MKFAHYKFMKKNPLMDTVIIPRTRYPWLISFVWMVGVFKYIFSGDLAMPRLQAESGEPHGRIVKDAQWYHLLCPRYRLRNMTEPTQIEWNPPDEDTIIFTQTSCGLKFNGRQACAVESAARHHRHRPVTVFITAPFIDKSHPLIKILSHIDNVHFSWLNLDDLFSDSPLQSWFQERLWLLNEEHQSAFISDAARSEILRKYGGTYMDLDALTLRPLPNRTNYLGRLDAQRITGAIMSLIKGHPLSQVRLPSYSILLLQIPFFRYRFHSLVTDSTLSLQIPFSSYRFHSLITDSILSLQIPFSSYRFHSLITDSILSLQIPFSSYRFHSLITDSLLSLQILSRSIPEAFKPFKMDSIGPALVNSILRKLCPGNLTESRYTPHLSNDSTEETVLEFLEDISPFFQTPEICSDLIIYPEKLFYPIGFQHQTGERYLLFKSGRGYGKKFLQVSRAYSLHLYSSLTWTDSVLLGGDSILEEVMKKNCPSVYQDLIGRVEVL
ncbi:uncharacterized protein [Palaemon carinicauda]|uniref:uncharacterized protein n=1 Tax=Palaemon carinicauda TaxID=392227 RepID=UPI0035B5C6C5